MLSNKEAREGSARAIGEQDALPAAADLPGHGLPWLGAARRWTRLETRGINKAVMYALQVT